MKTFRVWLIFAFFFIPVKSWCMYADNKKRIIKSGAHGSNVAKTENCFVINLTTGQQYNFAFSEIPVITFEGGKMIVTTVSNSINIPIQSVTSGKFLKVNPIVIAANSYSREYGDGNPVFEYTSEGETLDGEPEIVCEANETSPVGTYDIVVKQGTVKNYNVNYVDGTLNVTKAPLTVKAGDYTMKQGEALPEFVALYEGWKNDDTEAVLTKLPTFTTTATSESEPGTYDVVVSGAEALNYDISYTKGTLTITEADPVTITSQSYTREYGDANPVFEYTSEGAALDGVPIITCDATETSPVGTYDIVVKQGTVKNYNVKYVDGSLTVTKAPLTVSVGNYTREYGQDNPEFTLMYSGYKNGEHESVLIKKPITTTDATKDSPVGEYAIRIMGGEAQNYSLNYVDSKLSIIETSGIDNILNDGKPFDVYNLVGKKVLHQVKSISGIPRGVYIVCGHVIFVR